MQEKKITKKYWNESSDEYYRKSFETGEILETITKNPERAFPEAVFPLIKKYLLDLKGKRVCIPSSGDNVAAFGFYLLGARVTSVDLAERQLDNAKKVASERGWDIEFVCDDSMELSRINSGEFDLVYTSNGVHVWISDLAAMYGNFNRILKKNGYYIFFETHPMIRPFDNRTYEVIIKKLYEDIGPFGEVPTYGWRTQDFVNSILSSGFNIKEMQEFHSVQSDLKSHNYLYVEENSEYAWKGDPFDWKINPWAALPQCLGLCSQKVL